MRQIILDTETTGLDPAQGHRLTEVGCLEMIDRCLTGKQFHTYLNPERELDAKAAEITGLSWSVLKDKPKFHEKVDDFVEFISGAELIIHNAAFDLRFLNAELSLLQHSFVGIQNHLSIIDTLALARALYPGQKNSLDALCRRLSISNAHRSLHGALLDAHILAEVYLSMTAGQTSFSLQEERNNPVQNAINIQGKLTRNKIKLPVLQASETELQLHQNRLLALHQLSKGKCQWLESETMID